MSKNFLGQFDNKKYEETKQEHEEFLEQTSGGEVLIEPLVEKETSQLEINAGSENTSQNDEKEVTLDPDSDDETYTKEIKNALISTEKEASKRDKALPLATTSNQRISAPAHIVTKDETFHKRKIIKYGIIASSTIISILLIWLMVRGLNRIEVPDFTGSGLSEATTWAIPNGIAIQREEEYSLEFDEDHIIEQSHEGGSRMSRGSVLTITVSLGADQTELIDLPDFEDMTTAQARTWRQELLVLGVNIREEHSEEVEQNQFIRMEVPSGVDVDHFSRGDTLNIYFSQGEETIQIPSFNNRTREDVESWADENEMTVIFEYEAHEDIPRDTVMNQDVRAGERIARTETLTITLSGGLAILVPDFNTLTHEEAMEIGVQVTSRHRFHATVPYGRVISQSQPAGTELFSAEDEVTVVYSLGLPFINDLRGQSEGELASIFFDFQSRGANITYSVSRISSDQPRGTVVSMSRYAEFLPMSAHIYIQVSLGDRAPAPDAVPAPSLDLDPELDPDLDLD